MSPSQRETRGAEPPRPPRRSRVVERLRAPRRAAGRRALSPAGPRPAPSARRLGRRPRRAPAASGSAGRGPRSCLVSHRATSSPSSAATLATAGAGPLEVEPLGRRDRRPRRPPPRRATWSPIERRSGGWNRENVRRSSGSRSSKRGLGDAADPVVDDREQGGVVDQQHRLPRQEPVEPGGARRRPGAPTDSRRLIRVGRLGLVDPPGVEQQPVDPTGDRAVHPVAGRDRDSSAAIQRPRISSSSSSATPRWAASMPARTASAASSSRPTQAAGRPTAARTTRARSTCGDAADVDAADVAVADRARQRLDGAEQGEDVVLPGRALLERGDDRAQPVGQVGEQALRRPAAPRVARSSEPAGGARRPWPPPRRRRWCRTGRPR